MFRTGNSKLMIQLYIHHFIGLFGICVGLFMDGFFGSISQLTWFTEGSTFFVDLRHLLLFLKLENSLLYLVNGFFMCVTFFIFRVLYYDYVIFTVIKEWSLYRSEAFWDVLYQDQMKT